MPRKLLSLNSDTATEESVVTDKFTQAVEIDNAEEALLPTEPSVSPTAQLTTKWDNLLRLRARPIEIRSLAYRPVHRADMSTHTRIPPTAANMMSLIEQTGGGFAIRMAPSKSAWVGWTELRKAGVECTDFRCAVCGKREALNPVRIAEHFKVHPNVNRRMERGGLFYITLSSTKRPQMEEDDADEDIFIGHLVAQ